MAAVTSPARHAALLATSASNREPRQSKAHRAMEWPKPSSARSSVTMSASVRVRMQRPSCTSYQLGSLTTTRFTRTRHSDIVHPVSSSQLTEARDRVRSFGGYNNPMGPLSQTQSFVHRGVGAFSSYIWDLSLFFTFIRVEFLCSACRLIRLTGL